MHANGSKRELDSIFIFRYENESLRRPTSGSPNELSPSQFGHYDPPPACPTPIEELVSF